MDRYEKVARLLAEVAVTKNPRRYGFQSSERYTVDAVAEIVERSWPNYVREAEELETRLGLRVDWTGDAKDPARAA